MSARLASFQYSVAKQLKAHRLKQRRNECVRGLRHSVLCCHQPITSSPVLGQSPVSKLFLKHDANKNTSLPVNITFHSSTSIHLLICLLLI